MLVELPYVVMLSAAILIALYLANIFYDYGIPQYISRKIGHLGGCAFFILTPFLFKTFWWPLIMTIGFSAILGAARWLRPKTFRGVGGSGRPGALAEIHFPATGIILISILWGGFNQPWLAIIPLTFMGAGDAITGLIRSRVYHHECKGLWGSAGMLSSCLLLAYFIHPYWIGAAGAVVATLAERFTKTTHFIDDNFTIPIASALVMAILHFML